MRVALLLLAFLASGQGALAQAPAETGPEDVPAENRFDPARMVPSLVVPRTHITRFRFPVVDAHSHDVYAQDPAAVAAWVKLQQQLGVEKTFIFTGKSGAEFRAAAARYAGAYPGRFVMFAGISAEGIASPGYGELLRQRLRADVRAGAAGLAELTDKGLGLVRVGDQAYFIDDPRFDPLWDEAGKLHVPVFVHIAEPARVLPACRRAQRPAPFAELVAVRQGHAGLRGHGAALPERDAAPPAHHLRGRARL